jgi:hypothetical protein
MSLIELAARAIWDYLQKDWPERVKESWDAPHPVSETIKEMQRDFCRGQARAALEAASECVTDAMVSAGYEAINATKQNFSSNNCGCDWSCSQTAIYRAMLRRELEGKE